MCVVCVVLWCVVCGVLVCVLVCVCVVCGWAGPYLEEQSSGPTFAGEFDRVEDREVVFYVQGGVHVFQRMRGEEDRTQLGLSPLRSRKASER